ncbi:hypothetical protein KAT92_06130 [Candidatus Babeliales bacterium]|nr:hypothetical protein [Candidatus Babeliales bacterium]
MALERYVKIGIEPSFGAGTTTAGILVTSTRDNPDRGILQDETIDDFLPKKAYGGPLKLAGTLEGNFRPDQMAPILEAVCGIKTPQTVPDRDEYTLGVPKSLEIEIGEETGTGLNRHTDFIGCGVKEISFSGEAKDFLKFSAEWIAKNFSDGSFAAPTYVAEDPVVVYNTALKIDAVKVAEVKAFECKMTRPLDEENYVIDDFTLHDLMLSGLSEITGSITLTEKEYDELKRANYGAVSNTAIDANNTIDEFALSIHCTDMSGADKFEINMPVTVMTDSARSISGRDSIEKSVNFKATSSAGIMFKIFT